MLSRSEIRERYLNVYTAAVCDVLDELGFNNQSLRGELHALLPDTCLAGFATLAKGSATIKPIDPENNPGLEFVARLQEDQVVVLDAAGDVSSAHWGELMSTAAQARGCRGAVILGGIRDVEKIIQLGFQVFYQHRIPADINGRWNYLEFETPIYYGGVVIHKHDFILGDQSGIVVVPNTLIQPVLLKAEEIVNTENVVRLELKAGKNPIEVFNRYGRF